MPPVFVAAGMPAVSPPHTIIFEPVHTAECPYRGEGAPSVERSLHRISRGGAGSGLPQARTVRGRMATRMVREDMARAYPNASRSGCAGKALSWPHPRRSVGFARGGHH